MADQRPGTIALDSCVLIELFDENSTVRRDVREIITRAEQGELVLMISTFVLAEVAANSKNATDMQILDIRRAMSQSYFEPVEVSVPIGLLAADLAREHGLKPADSVHAATCVSKGVSWLITTDRKLLAVHRKVGMSASDRSKLLNIVTPETFCKSFYPTLFDE